MCDETMPEQFMVIIATQEGGVQERAARWGKAAAMEGG